MTRRDFGWALGGFWACVALVAFTVWWQDQKSGIKQVEVPAALTQTMEHVEQVAATYEQIKVASQINEDAYIKKWAAFELRLKKLETQLNANMHAINQYRSQQETMVARQPKAPLPAPQLVRLAKEVGFTKVEVRP